MEERESRNRGEENPNENKTEQKASNIGKVAEQTASAAVHVALKNSETKEKLIINKETKKLKTEIKSGNFHSDARGRKLQSDRPQADRLVSPEDNLDEELDDEDIYGEKLNSEDSDDNATQAYNTGKSKSGTVKDYEAKPAIPTEHKKKKNMRLKARERMRKERQREFNQWRYDSADSGTDGGSHYHHDDTVEAATYEGFLSGSFTAVPNEQREVNEQAEDKNTDFERPESKRPIRDAETDEYSGYESYRLEEDNSEFVELQNPNEAEIPSRLNTENPKQPLKFDKTEDKLKTESRNAFSTEPNTAKDSEEKSHGRRKKRKAGHKRSLTQEKTYEKKTAQTAHQSANTYSTYRLTENKNDYSGSKLNTENPVQLLKFDKTEDKLKSESSNAFNTEPNTAKDSKEKSHGRRKKRKAGHKRSLAQEKEKTCEKKTAQSAHQSANTYSTYRLTENKNDYSGSKLNTENPVQLLKFDKTEDKLKSESRNALNTEPKMAENSEEKFHRRRLKHKSERKGGLTERKVEAFERKNIRSPHTYSRNRLNEDKNERLGKLKAERKKRLQKLKFQKRERTALVDKKYILTKSRINHASAVSKLITNSGEEKDENGSLAEREQEKLNKNVLNVASTGLKSVAANYDLFEAKFLSKHNISDSQKEFTKKKQRKKLYIRKKNERAAEIKRDEEAVKPRTEQYAANTDGAKGDFNLKDANTATDDFNLRDSGNAESLNGRNGGVSLKRHEASNGSLSDKEDMAKRRKKSSSDISDKTLETENPAVISPERQKKKTADNAGKEKKSSRLKHEKTTRMSEKLKFGKDNASNASSKLKFSKDNAAVHEQRHEKLKFTPPKDSVAERTAKVSGRNKAAQKKQSRKALRKRMRKNKQKMAENTLRQAIFGKNASEKATKKILEAVKLLIRLIIQKLLILILFIFSQILTIAAFLIIPIIIISIIVVIITAITAATAGTLIFTNYLASDENLTAATVYYAQREEALEESLDVRDLLELYDADQVYWVRVDDIGHDPHQLLCYLTAKYYDFTFEQVKNELDELFALQYDKTINAVTSTVTNEKGESSEFRVVYVTLINNGLYDILESRLTSDEREHFLLLLDTADIIPYDENGVFTMYWDWLLNITNDFTNRNNGVEAEMPENTPVYATINGEITDADSDSVSIEATDGEDVLTITFSNLDSVIVDMGDTVEMTAIVGYTSDRILIQIQRNGVYVNPELFFGGGLQDDLVYGTTVPPLSQSEFNDLTDFAEDALGTPYVFGASNPPIATDCSGFIWWAYNGSGVASWGRMTAQGQFNQCDPILLSDARPGDLIFFQGTYDTGDSRDVTHIGIYLGNGLMQHSGSPNQISSINTSYWQEHFYSFGRLRR